MITLCELDDRFENSENDIAVIDKKILEAENIREYAFKTICCNNIFVMVFDPKTHAKNDQTFSFFRRILSAATNISLLWSFKQNKIPIIFSLCKKNPSRP